MPKVFAIPGAKAEPGKTFYRGFSGKSTLFDATSKDGKRVGLADVVDGTSNTIGVVEAKEAVIWTKPDGELPFDAKLDPANAKIIFNLVGGHFAGGFNVLFLDGSVRFIKSSVNPNVLRAPSSHATGVRLFRGMRSERSRFLSFRSPSRS